MKYLYILFSILSISNLCKAQNIDFTDQIFKDVLINQNCAEIVNIDGLVDVDTNNDGEIQISEAEAVRVLRIPNFGINDISGIEFFTNLTDLRAERNNIVLVNLSQLSKLTLLDLSQNQLTSLDVTELPELFSLYCNDNNLTSLKFRDYSNISDFIIYNNPNLGNLDSVALSRNRFNYMYVWNTGITSIDVSHMEFLTEFQVGNNRLKTLDLSSNKYLRSFSCQDSPLLESVNFKNGFNDLISSDLFYATNCPKLKTICVDDVNYANENYVNVEEHIEFVTNCNLTEINNYLIYGTVSFDNGQNDCGSDSTPVVNLKIEISSASSTFTTFTSKNGTYKLSVPKGEYLVKPVTRENYLFSNPQTNTVILNDDNTSSVANFCINSNQEINDLDVGILPLLRTRQDSETTYQINLFNNGSTTRSGEIKFEFDSSKQSFVGSTNGRINQNLEEILFSYTNLKPLAQNSVNLILRTEGPPIVGEDEVLELSASLLDTENDFFTENNDYSLQLHISKNNDTNDVRVLQGNEIEINQITDYLEYIVRFRNLGTSEVKNLILVVNLSGGFAISTFLPINYSHENNIDIINDSFVSINFENINLTSIIDDNSNNEGYFAFKIKPNSPNISVGDILELDADIYFDEEDAIRTNKAITEIAQTLSLPDILIENFKVYPNPSQSYITIKSNEPIKGINLYDLNGRKMKELDLNESETLLHLDLGALINGIYYLVVRSTNNVETFKIANN